MDRTTVTPENVGEKVHLRVELQSFWRLPRSNAILFPIRCFLISLDELVTVPKWAPSPPPGPRRRCPPSLPTTRASADTAQTTIDWLAAYDDGAPTSPGFFPDP